MLLLAIETSSVRGSLALFRGRQCLRETFFPEGLVHGREISARLAELLELEGFRARDLEGLAVSAGPGSYTGCRVGVTAAKTLAWALKLPLVAVSSLEVVAATALGRCGSSAAGEASAGGARAAALDVPEFVATLLDGRRGFLYGALFAASAARDEPGRPAPKRLSPDQVGRHERILQILKPGTWVCGDGADLLVDGSSDDPLRRTFVRAPKDWDLPSARSLGWLAASAVEGASFDLENLHRLEPAYLRPSEPEILWQEKARGRSSGSGGSR